MKEATSPQAVPMFDVTVETVIGTVIEGHGHMTPVHSALHIIAEHETEGFPPREGERIYRFPGAGDGDRITVAFEVVKAPTAGTED